MTTETKNTFLQAYQTSPKKYITWLFFKALFILQIMATEHSPLPLINNTPPAILNKRTGEAEACDAAVANVK